MISSFFLKKNFQTIQRGAVLQPEDKPSNLLLLFSYLTWLRINKTIERNLLMADQLRNAFSKNNQSQLTGGQSDQSPAQKQQQAVDEKIKNAKPQDIVRLYDIILQVLNSFLFPFVFRIFGFKCLNLFFLRE